MAEAPDQLRLGESDLALAARPDTSLHLGHLELQFRNTHVRLAIKTRVDVKKTAKAAKNQTSPSKLTATMM
jgi:hypothetical protein